MRRSLLAAALLAALVLPLAAFAQEADDEDAELDPLIEMMMSGEGIAQADPGTEDNGWFFTQENGVCRMYSFNDPLVIQANPSDPLGTRFQFQMIDREVPEAHGTQVPMIVAMRDKPDAQFEGFNAAAVASHDIRTNGYLMTVPLGDLVTRYPNGFQLVLMDKDQKPIMQSDTLGSAKHLAKLAACGKGS